MAKPVKICSLFLRNGVLVCRGATRKPMTARGRAVADLIRKYNLVLEEGVITYYVWEDRGNTIDFIRPAVKADTK